MLTRNGKLGWWRYSIRVTRLLQGHTISMSAHTARQVAMVMTLGLFCFFPSIGAQNIDFLSIELQTVKVADGLYVLMGGPAQGNIAVSVGNDGILLIDSMYAPMHQ